jgi:hypothetical protein
VGVARHEQVIAIIESEMPSNSVDKPRIIGMYTPYRPALISNGI